MSPGQITKEIKNNINSRTPAHCDLITVQDLNVLKKKQL